MIVEKLENLISPDINRLGFILWGVEIIDGTKNNNIMTARIYIDNENGISLDHCQQVSEIVGILLDLEKFFPNPYILEVSSPGRNRRIFTALQAIKFIGSEVKIRLINNKNMLHNKHRRFKGFITRVVEKEVMLQTETGSINFNFSNIEKMIVVPKLWSNSKGKG